MILHFVDHASCNDSWYYQESLHDARSTKCKILQCKTSNTTIHLPKVHYDVCRSLSLDSIVSHLKPVCIHTPYYFKIQVMSNPKLA
jgi:hypothetical protein